MNGFLALFLAFMILVVIGLTIVYAATTSETTLTVPIIGIIILAILFFIGLAGFFSQEPNETRVMILFGKYKGTFSRTGFFWVNPFLDKKNFPFVPEI